MKILRDLILEGKISYYRIIKKTALFLSFLPIPVYILSDIGSRTYGMWGWNILIGIMLIRPLADVFPGLKILRTLTTFRKEFGIASAWLIIVHAYAVFAPNGKNVFIEIFKPEYWKFSSPSMWGFLGLITVIILLLTSNNLSLRLLRNNWKRIQRLSYPLFFFGAVHIALISRQGVTKILLPVLAVLVFWILAHFKIKVPLFIKSGQHMDSEQQPK